MGCALVRFPYPLANVKSGGYPGYMCLDVHMVRERKYGEGERKCESFFRCVYEQGG